MCISYCLESIYWRHFEGFVKDKYEKNKARRKHMIFYSTKYELLIQGCLKRTKMCS